MARALTARLYPWGLAGLLAVSSPAPAQQELVVQAHEGEAADRSLFPYFDNWLEWDCLTGGWGGTRKKLADAGFTPYANYTSELLSNVAGGFDTGANLNGLVDFGFGLDYEKLLGWKGSSFFMSWHWYHGNMISQNLVGVYSGQNVSGYEASQAFRFYSIYQQQNFFDDKLIVKFGQFDSDDYFALSAYEDYIFNAGFGALPSTDTVSNLPIYPLAGPGIYLRADPVKELTIQLACFTSDVGLDLVTNHGFGWEVGTNAGYSIVGELAFHLDLFENLPTTIKLGGLWNTGPNIELTTGNIVRGNGDMWMVVDQALAVDESGNTKIGAFTVISYAPDQSLTAIPLYIDGGLSFYGPLPNRPDDIFGVAAGYAQYSSGGRAVQGVITGVAAPSTTVVETSYTYQVAPWLQLQPDFQVFFQPNLSDRTAYTVNFRTIIAF